MPANAVDTRIPPHAEHAEQAVLSALLIDESAFDEIGDVLQPEHFFREPNRRTFEAIVGLTREQARVDIVSVAEALKASDRLRQVGGMEYLTELLNAAPAIGPKALRTYAEQVHGAWRAREVIRKCQYYVARGYAAFGDGRQFASDAAQDLATIATAGESRDLTHVRDGLIETFERIALATTSGRRIVGTSTGFHRYDRITAGLHNGELTIVAARPGMGKTTLVLNLMVNVAVPTPLEAAAEVAPRLECVFFSLEMPRAQLIDRLLCAEARVDSQRMRTGLLTHADNSRLTEAARALGDMQIWIDDTPAMSVMQIRAKVRKLANEARARGNRLALAAIDYLQLMTGEGASREQEVSSCSRGLKALAKESEIPILCLSQLNRAVESRGEKSKRPQLSDLRESGAIEQDADNICFIYRDDYYNKDSADRGVAELIIAKQRNGPTDTVKVRFDGGCTRFENLAEGTYED